MRCPNCLFLRRLEVVDALEREEIELPSRTDGPTAGDEEGVAMTELFKE